MSPINSNALEAIVGEKCCGGDVEIFESRLLFQKDEEQLRQSSFERS
jgi:hypothetical protein